MPPKQTTGHCRGDGVRTQTGKRSSYRFSAITQCSPDKRQEQNSQTKNPFPTDDREPEFQITPDTHTHKQEVLLRTGGRFLTSLSTYKESIISHTTHEISFGERCYSFPENNHAREVASSFYVVPHQVIRSKQSLSPM